jgi:hypothetical protein
MTPTSSPATHTTCSYFWADLVATLDAHGLTPLLEERLARPALGDPMYAARRRRCRILWLESHLALLRHLDELESEAAA